MQTCAVPGSFHLIIPFLQLIAQPLNRDKQLRFRRVVFYLLPYMAYVDHDRIVTDTAVFPPNLLIQTFFAYDPAGVFGHIRQKKEFPPGQFNFFSVFTYAAALAVYRQTAGRQQLFLLRRYTVLILLPAQLCLYTERNSRGLNGFVI